MMQVQAAKQAFVPVNEPLLNGNEKKYLNECIDTGWISSEGPFVHKFEELFAARMHRKHGIAVANGTAALEVAVRALELEPGSQIIMPTFTIISCAIAAVRAGCQPVFVDADAQTWNMNVAAIEQKITPRTKAIMVVHIYGLPTDMEPVLELAKKYDLKIIEDAAQAIGQTYNDKPCGSFGDISIVSFYPNKHVTTGEGGMVMTDDDHLAERSRSLRNLCFKKERRYVHDELGYNYRMTNLQAAVGVAQLEQLDLFLKKKRLIGQFYTTHLRRIGYLELPLERTPYADNLYWVYGIVLKDSVSFDAFEMMKLLEQRGIGTRAFFWGLHEQPVFTQHEACVEQFPVAQRLARRGLYIPSGIAITQEQMDRVVQAIKEIFS
ncbi:DegT/DnrJ/EryC1/StrS family aminotransferase [Candidatus Babeliales bacterium]|nr:DegT/DnrJ/EryC1/StrS family aminotransferase [Candidatus Babeliales bacterium]